MKMKLLLVVLFMHITFLSALAGTTGKIAGTIRDASTRELLVGANVMVAATTLGSSSDDKGYYCILNVPPGTYDVRVSYIGYQTVIKKQVVVNVDRTTTVDFSLTATSVTLDAVEIVAQKEVIIRDLTSTVARVSSQDIANLPVENISDVLQLQAGITKDAGGQLHMRGGRASEVQYYVDGMSVTNPFGVGMAVAVQNNNIQELQVISGTFNAEYGQAMSGIVNIVTKDGGDDTHFSLSAYSGDFFSPRNDVFRNIDRINPLTQKYVEGTLSGPVYLLTEKLHYFFSGRYRNEENWLYGRRYYTPADTADFTSTDPSKWTIQHTGDNSFVPMNPAKDFSLQGKISYQPINALSISYNLIWDKSESKSYRHAYMLSPDYLPTSYSNGMNHLLKLTHTLSPTAFHELKLSSYNYSLDRYVRSNPFDPIYDIGIHRTQSIVQDVFAIGGVDPSFLYRKSTTIAVKYEFTNQMNHYHLVKLGVEYRQHTLTEEMFEVRKDEGTNWQLRIDDLTSLVHNYYKRKPVELAAYIQDKIEVGDFIVNGGVRFDYFTPKSKVPQRMDDPGNKRGADESVVYRDATRKMQVSPRIGLAFPMSERGNIHASYGQFFQIPEFQRLYENPEFEVVGRFTTFIGNADLEAQRTAIYEIGVQQLLAENFVLNATCYSKDYRHLAGSKLFKTFDQDEYGQYANVDYGNVWGITLALDMLRTGIISGSVDYTYQVADGNGSDPYQAYYDARNRDESTKSLVPLNWDQRHVLNAVVSIEDESWGLTSINRFASGIPYTPTTTFDRTRNIQMMNQGRRRGEYNMDLRLYKNVDVFGLRTTFFVSVENLLDAERIDYKPELTQQDLKTHESRDRFNSLYDYRFDPSSQPRPRLVKIGFRTGF